MLKEFSSQFCLSKTLSVSFLAPVQQDFSAVLAVLTVYSQVDWLYYSVLHGGSGTGIQLPGPAVRHPGLRQARLTNNTRLHLKHGGNDADCVSLLPEFKL